MPHCPSDPVEFDQAINDQVDRIVSSMGDKEKYRLMRLHVDKYAPCPCGSGKQFKWCCWSKGND